jgi:hypothetical protein
VSIRCCPGALTQHVAEATSEFVGANIPGKTRVLRTSPDAAPVMWIRRAEVAVKGHEGFLWQSMQFEPGALQCCGLATLSDVLIT